MSGLPMEITKEALSIFLRSLPPGCNFSILSFGSDCEFSLYDKKQTIPYCDEALETIDKQVKGFWANFGGTDIYTPLKKALDMKSDR